MTERTDTTAATAPDAATEGSERAVRLLQILRLEPIEENLLRGHNEVSWQPARGDPAMPQRLFGGQVLAQSLQAAYHTVEDRDVHSLHGYFLRAGSTQRPVLYEVDRIRDGRSFTTRRVVAIQKGEAIFSLSASFQKRESGFEHAASMPNVPPPEELGDDVETARSRQASGEETYADLMVRGRPFYTRSVYPVGSDEWRQQRRWNPVWIRFRADIDPLPEGHSSLTRLRHVLLAYASDMGMVSTAALPNHGGHDWRARLQLASLDHALWLHQPELPDDWLLVNKHTTSAGAGRGMSHAEFFTRDGQLVASVTQEGLVRERSG